MRIIVCKRRNRQLATGSVLHSNESKIGITERVTLGILRNYQNFFDGSKLLEELF